MGVVYSARPYAGGSIRGCGVVAIKLFCVYAQKIKWLDTFNTGVGKHRALDECSYRSTLESPILDMTGREYPKHPLLAIL